jgi:hypothetical protein
VQVQNKLQLAMPLLPQEVQQQGVQVSQVGAQLPDGDRFRSKRARRVDLADFIVSSNLQDPLSRVPASARCRCSAQYAMRIWLDPAKLNNYRLTPADIRTAIRRRTRRFRPASSAARPALPGQGSTPRLPPRVACRLRRSSRHPAAQFQPRRRCATGRCGADRNRRPGKLRHRRAAITASRRRVSASAGGRRQCAENRHGGARRARRNEAFFPAGVDVVIRVRHHALRQASPSRKWSRPCSRPSCWCSW